MTHPRLVPVLAGTSWQSNRVANGSSDGDSALLTSAPLAIYDAVSSPNTVATHARAASMPALTPEEVQNFPSCTHLAFATQSTLGPKAVHCCQNDLFVVALLPSRAPVCANSDAPLHTVMTCLVLGTMARKNSSSSAVGSNAPKPPGMKRTSSSEISANVHVGTMRCPTVCIPFQRVDTGSSVDAITDRESSCCVERVLTTSNGPKASKASKPGNSTIPTWRGTSVYQQMSRSPRAVGSGLAYKLCSNPLR